jgi:hypothetical protein
MDDLTALATEAPLLAGFAAGRSFDFDMAILGGLDDDCSDRQEPTLSFSARKRRHGPEPT